MPRKRTSRLYWRRGRAYGDFRDLGGGQEALVLPEHRATMKRPPAVTDPDVAAKLCADRVAELMEKRKNKAHGIEEKDPAPALGVYAEEHLKQKARDNECTDLWLATSELHLQRACDFFGEDRPLDAIDPKQLTAFVNHLRKMNGRRGQHMCDTTVRKVLNTLSSLFKRAVSEGIVAANPVAQMYTKPTEPNREAEYLEPEEVALLLESARTYKPAVEAIPQEDGSSLNPRGNPHVYQFIAQRSRSPAAGSPRSVGSPGTELEFAL